MQRTLQPWLRWNLRYEGSIAIPGGRDETIYFEGPDDIEVHAAENLVRDLFGEQLMWFRPAPSPVVATGPELLKFKRGELLC